MHNLEVNLARRKWVKRLGLATGLVAAAPWLNISAAPVAAAADWASLHGTASIPPAEDGAATITRLYGTRTIEYSDDKIKLTVPNVAENGAVVPTEVELTAPLDKDTYVKRITWIIDKNKRPQTIVFDFTPETGAGYAAAYLRMGQSSWVHAILELSDGKLLGAKKEVKVVAGGCGG